MVHKSYRLVGDLQQTTMCRDQNSISIKFRQLFADHGKHCVITQCVKDMVKIISEMLFLCSFWLESNGYRAQSVPCWNFDAETAVMETALHPLTLVLQS